MIEELETHSKPTRAAEASARLARLVELLESDRLGYRLERFVSAERERLTEELTTDAFSTSTQIAPKTWPDMFGRVQAYDALVLPWVEFFAVGCAYSKFESASVWMDFLERIARCNFKTEGMCNEAARNLTLYPALLLLYGAGIYAAIRRSWVVMKGLLSQSFPLDYNEARLFVLRSNSFAILQESAQRAIPGREREYTPLLNHMYEILFDVLGQYTLSKAKYTEAFSYWEVVMAASIAYESDQEEIARGCKSPDNLWTPPARYWWHEHWQGTSLERLAREAIAEGSTWPPIAAGLYGGKTEAFVSVVPKIKARISRIG